MNVRYTLRALSQLDAIYCYIAQHNPAAAERVKRYIQEAIDRLADFPMLGRATGKPGVHKLVLADYPYRIYYRVRGNEVMILRIRHGAQRD